MPARTYPARRPARPAPDARAAGRGPGDRTIRLAAGRAWRATRTPDGPATRGARPRRRRAPRRGLGPGRGAGPGRRPGAGRARPGAAPRWRTPIPTVDAPRAAVPGRPDPADAARSSSRSSRPSSSRRSSARRRAGRCSSSSGATASRRPDRPSSGLRLPPAPATLAALPYYAYHPFGVERRRAELIRRVAAARGLVRGDRRPAARRGLRAADRRARDRAVDRGRGRRSARSATSTR